LIPGLQNVINYKIISHPNFYYTTKICMEEFVKGQPIYLFEQVLSFNPLKKKEIQDIRFGAVGWGGGGGAPPPPPPPKKKKKKKPGVMVIEKGLPGRS
jgi:hypothetical protein